MPATKAAATAVANVEARRQRRQPHKACEQLGPAGPASCSMTAFCGRDCKSCPLCERGSVGPQHVVDDSSNLGEYTRVR